MLNDMLNKIVDIFRTALDRIDRLQFNTCGEFSSFRISRSTHFAPTQSVSHSTSIFDRAVSSPWSILDHRTSPLRALLLSDASLEPAPTKDKGGRDSLSSRELLRDVEDNAEALAEKLSAFEGAWHVVGNACSQLSADLELAKGFTTVRRARHSLQAHRFTS